MTNANIFWSQEDLPTEAILCFRNLAGSENINIKSLYDDVLNEEIQGNKPIFKSKKSQ